MNKLSTRRLLLWFFAAALLDVILSGCEMISGRGGTDGSGPAETTGDPRSSDGANVSYYFRVPVE